MEGGWSPTKEGFGIVFPAHGLFSFHGSLRCPSFNKARFRKELANCSRRFFSAAISRFSRLIAIQRLANAYFTADKGDGEAVSQCFSENAVVKDEGAHP
jgi:hypothetical protein